MPIIQSIFLLCRKLNTMENLLEENIYADVPMAKNGVPKKLNTLTTLTFIANGIMLVFSLLTPILLPFAIKFFDRAITSGAAELTPDKLADLEKTRNLFETLNANIIPLTIIGIIGMALRISGAVQMRKLKKDGFWIYVAGHIIPFVGSIVVMGVLSQLKQGGTYFGIAMAGLFIFLYSKERKLLQ